MKFSIKDFFRISSYLLKKYLLENLIFCAVNIEIWIFSGHKIIGLCSRQKFNSFPNFELKILGIQSSQRKFLVIIHLVRTQSFPKK